MTGQLVDLLVSFLVRMCFALIDTKDKELVQVQMQAYNLLSETLTLFPQVHTHKLPTSPSLPSLVGCSKMVKKRAGVESSRGRGINYLPLLPITSSLVVFCL